MAAASVRTAQDIFTAIQSLPAVQRDALLFAACQNHADVSARVFEARPVANSICTHERISSPLSFTAS
jgi:hypothetical protein